MYLDRLLKYINTIIGLALILAIGAAYWFAYRPLPSTSGTIEAFVDNPVTITRDSLGTPHIAAGSLEDALFVQGYVTAQDRLWQMDSLRRLAGGELAEIVGAVALESDREARNLRLRRIAEDAYAHDAARRPRRDGRLRARRQRVHRHAPRATCPLEFTLLGYSRGRGASSIRMLVGLHMYRNLTTTWKDEIVKRNMLAGGDAAKVDFLFPGAHRGRSAARARTPGPWRGAYGFRQAAALERYAPGVFAARHLVHDAPAGAGHECGRRRLPGAPGIIVGHNDRIAWGITNLHFDVQDLYIEKMDDRTGRYLFRGQVEQARAEREMIRVKGAAPVELTVWVTRHGPLLVAERARAADACAGRPRSPACCSFPFLDIDRAQNWQEFTAALGALPGPGLRISCMPTWMAISAITRPESCRSGAIMPATCRWTARRANSSGMATFRSSNCRPSINPPAGLIVTANQNPFPADYPYRGERKLRVPLTARSRSATMLSARNGWQAGGDAGRAERRLFRVQPLPGAVHWWRPTTSGKAHNPGLDGRRRPAARLERADGIRARPRRCW